MVGKLLEIWVKLWHKITWIEVIFISITIVFTMIYIREEVATYSVKCENGSTYKLQEGMNYVCNNYVMLNEGHIEIMTRDQYLFNEFIYHKIHKLIFSNISYIRKK